MSHAGDHKPNPFSTVYDAMDLASYVLMITDNINKFPDYFLKEKKNPDGTITQIYVFREDSLTNVVRAEAREMYRLADQANRINLKKQPWRKEERLGKQEKAIDLCEDLLADIQLCGKRFHLSKQKVEHWGKKTEDVLRKLEGWHEKDKARYRDI